MNEARTCENCGAAVEAAAVAFCGYCGAELPRRLAPAAVPTLADRFEALEKHPRRAEYEALDPPTSAPALGLKFRSGIAIFFMVISGSIAGGALFITVVFAVLGGPLAIVPCLMSLMPMGFVALGVWLLRRSQRELDEFNRAPLLCTPAHVKDERTRVSGGGKNHGATTSYYASIEWADGSRNEFVVAPKIAGEITAGDMGFAYTKGKYLVAFERVDV